MFKVIGISIMDYDFIGTEVPVIIKYLLGRDQSGILSRDGSQIQMR